MNFLSITSDDHMWEKVRQFAANCSWGAGKSLSQNMSDNTFTDWERVIVALYENDIAVTARLLKAIVFQMSPIRPILAICSLMKSTEVIA